MAGVLPVIDPGVCANCRYFAASGAQAAVGICHRYPPQITTVAEMPMVVADNWCGEWKESIASLKKSVQITFE